MLRRPKFIKTARIALAAMVLIFLPTEAHAFPVAEGAGALSSLIGVITSVIVGFFPKGGLPGQDRRLAGAISVAVLACMLAAGAFAWVWSLTGDDRDWEAVAAQSRPKLELAGEIRKEIAADVATPLTETERAYAAARDIFLDVEAYRHGRIAPDAARVFIDYEATSRLALPYHSTINFAPGEQDALVSKVVELKGRAILVADHPETIIRTAMLIERQTGFQLQGIPLRSAAFSITSERQTEIAGEYPTVRNPREVFALPLVDIRTRQNIRETHTLINAANLPATDILLMRDQELERAFPLGEPKKILIGYDEALYPAVHSRLKEAVPGRYAFYEGGLETHFLEDGLTITPYYYNMRFIDPGKLIETYGLTGRVKFICTTTDSCLDNIPAKDRIVLPYHSMSREDFTAALRELPRDGLYVTVTTNQETYGNSLIAGYLLVTNGHQYLGDLIMPARFSLEELRARIISETGEEPSLDEWRETHRIFLSSIEVLSALVAQHGWFAVFLALGICARLALSPFQFIVFRSYYRTHSSILPMLTAALIIPGALIAVYQFLDTAISYYGAVPHQTMNHLRQGQVAHLLPWFVGMIVLQIAISFPLRPKTALPIVGLILAIWAMGWMNALPLPLLVFLMASEAVAIALQLPWFAAHLRRAKDEARGITVLPMPERAPDSYPSKWLKLTSFRPQPGFLVDLRRPYDDSSALHRELAKLRSQKIIVRSAALDPREERLGGYYSSHVVTNDRSHALKALESLRQSGCAFGWVQPFIEADENGVLSSISREGRIAECISGPGDSATEGGKDAKVYDLSLPVERRSRKAEWRLLRAAERHCKCAVILEYGRSGGRVIPYQLRTLEEETHPEVRLWPRGIERHTLAEDYMAQCSRLGGDIIAAATSEHYTHVRGFLYRRSGGAPSYLWVGHNRLQSLEGQAIILLGRCHSPGYAGPAEILGRIEDGITLLGKLFRASQSRLRPSETTSRVDISCIEATRGSELDVLSEHAVRFEELWREPHRVDVRTHLHDLIVMVTAAISMTICRAVPDADARARIGLAHLRGASFAEPGPVQKDRQPLTSISTEMKIIVDGEILGTPWAASNQTPPPADGTRWILVGEEISSEWVKHLEAFSGLLSVYGHPNAHLGLSARALGIPYRLISQDALSVFLSTGKL